jgi:hypothetical protein
MAEGRATMTSDLPSREDADTLVGHISKWGYDTSIIAAYAEGRLIDRETIDYKAAQDDIERLVDAMSDMALQEGSYRVPKGAGRAIVDAAFGDRKKPLEVYWLSISSSLIATRKDEKGK